MKLLVSTILLFASTCASSQKNWGQLTGNWSGSAVSHGQQVPIHLELSGGPGNLRAALINGPERSPASSARFADGQLRLRFDYFGKTLNATLGKDGKLTGSFGTMTVQYPVTLGLSKPFAATNNMRLPKPLVDGDWEVAVHSAKGEGAWQLHIDQESYEGNVSRIKAVIQRIDGDTGSLYGECSAGSCLVSHFTAAGPALYRFTFQDDTLLVSNLLRADLNPPEHQNLVARRPAAARAAKLAAPTESTRQTTMKDPNARLQFSAPDLSGHLVSNTDPRFDGKVLLVAVGGSWCPNCHDEAPMLESLYRQFHDRGLEIVDLSFEEDEDELKDPQRLRAFIARYHLDYPVLLAGTTEQLNEKIPQADNLNCWPTSFILGRDGRVREIHAGFAGPANPRAHEALVHEVTDLVSTLLDEPVPTQTASMSHRR